MRNTFRATITVFVLTAAIGGCTVGPDYTRPKVETPEYYRYEEANARELADTEWWKQFGDPVIDELISDALANNKTVQIAALNVQAAVAVLTQSRSGYFPQVGYQGTGGQRRFSESNDTPLMSNVPNPQSAYEALLGASWELDLWGRIRRLSESARASALATEEARRGTILSLVATTANSYLQLRSLDYQLEIAKRTLATYAEAVRLFELQFKYGQVSRLTLEQARSQYELAAATIPSIERSIAITENAISVLLGRNPGSVPRGKPLLELTLPEIPAGVPSQLLARRPDIAQAEQQLIAANAQIGAAKAQYFPTISLTGAFGSASGDLSNLFTGSSRTWNYSGSLTGPLFTGGLISGQVAQAEAGTQAALINYQAVIQSAFADVENALISREKLAQQVDAEARRVKALTEYARLAKLQYDDGYSNYLTVLNAQQQLLPAEINYAQNLGQKYSALVNIYKSMGGGWIDKADALAPQPVEDSSMMAAPIPRSEAASSSAPAGTPATLPDASNQ